MKKIVFVLAFILTGMAAFGAKYTDLTDRDEGILLFHQRQHKVYVFKKTTGNNFWQCSLFRENKVEDLDPKYCIVLDADEESITAEDVAINYAYYSNRATWNRFKASAYRNIAKKMNAPAIMQILAFEMQLKKLSGSIDDKVNTAASIIRSEKMKEWMDKANNPVYNVKTSRNSFNKQPVRNRKKQPENNHAEAQLELIVEDLEVMLEKNECTKLIRRTADTDGNYFIAFSMYMKYYECVRRGFANLNDDLRKELSAEVLALGKELLSKYQQQRDKNKKRESDFRNLCQDMHGAWEYASALSMKEMQRSMKSFFVSYQNLRIFSYHTEFPKWGNCALEVLQMIESSELEKKFDAALASYQKRVAP